MKNLIITLSLFLCSAFSYSQVVDVGWANNTPTYYTGVFHSSGVSGNCPSTALTTFYHDIPDLKTHTEDARIENGSNVNNVSNLTGLTLQVYPAGNTYVIPFCTSGTPSATGNITIPETGIGGAPTTTIYWNINTGANTIQITFI